jgi:hypothetical protein
LFKMHFVVGRHVSLSAGSAKRVRLARTFRDSKGIRP